MSYSCDVQRDRGALRIALIEESGTLPASVESLAAVRESAQLCESLGHLVQPVSLPLPLPQFLEHLFTNIGAITRNHDD
ncbi:amidase, partial [Pseudomonas syringae pv. tagetis]